MTTTSGGKSFGIKSQRALRKKVIPKYLDNGKENPNHPDFIIDSKNKKNKEKNTQVIDNIDNKDIIEGKLEGKLEGMLEGMPECMLEGKLEGMLEGMPEGKLEGKLEGKAEFKDNRELTLTNAAEKFFRSRVLMNVKEKKRLNKTKSSVKSELARKKAVNALRKYEAGEISGLILDLPPSEKKFIKTIYDNLCDDGATIVISKDKAHAISGIHWEYFQSLNKSLYKKGLIDRTKATSKGGTVFWFEEIIKEPLINLFRLNML